MIPSFHEKGYSNMDRLHNKEGLSRQSSGQAEKGVYHWKVNMSLSPDPFCLEIECPFILEEQYLMSVKLSKRHIPEFYINHYLVIDEFPAFLAVFHYVLVRKRYLECFMNMLSGRQACLPEQATLFIRASAHLLAPSKSAWIRHVDLLLIIYDLSFLVSLLGPRGYIQNQPVGSRSAIRDDMPGLVIQVDFHNAYGNDSILFILAPKE